VPRRVASAIDIGCGRGITGALLRIYRNLDTLVGVDIYDPYLEFCKKLSIYDEVVKLDLRAHPLPFEDNQFDLSVSLEVLEHLLKDDGLALLDELERISRVVIVSTPNKFFHQPPFDNNPSQRHLSLWRVRDFRQRGYTVFGVGGLQILGKEFGYLSYALGGLTASVPRLSTTLMAIRSKPHTETPQVATDAITHFETQD